MNVYFGVIGKIKHGLHRVHLPGFFLFYLFVLALSPRRSTGKNY